MFSGRLTEFLCGKHIQNFEFDQLLPHVVQWGGLSLKRHTLERAYLHGCKYYDACDTRFLSAKDISLVAELFGRWGVPIRGGLQLIQQSILQPFKTTLKIAL